jgi:hypothetical protein
MACFKFALELNKLKRWMAKIMLSGQMLKKK